MAVVPPDLERLFATFETEAFRLEMQREYRLDEEWQLFTAAQSGEIVTEYPFPQWLDRVEHWKGEGKSVRRVMVSTAPPSAFFEFRIRQYRRNVQAGEEVRLVFTNDMPITGDFWLFDERVAAMLHHDAEGHLLRVEVTDEPGMISDLVEMKEDLEDWGEPIEGYWQRYLGSAADISSVIG